MSSFPSTLAWPPTYKIKKHRLAKHVKLRAVAPHGLEITVPYRFNLRDIPALLEEHKTWIAKQLLHLQLQKKEELPQQIIMYALHETWQIHYLFIDKKIEMIERPQREIVLVGRVHDKKLCHAKLVAWVKYRAISYLHSQLEIISQEINLSYKGVTIRDQQTRWGSCSATKNISLNYKLIFLPEHLVRHIIIHELCHTEYLNHSKRFWNLVAKYDPAWQTHKRELRKADQFIPGWLSSCF